MHARYQKLQSSQGFRIGLATLPESERAAISIHIPVGSRDDPDELDGLAHFSEHMAFKGTATRDARRISTETEDLGASVNAWTSEDETVYEAHGDADTLPMLATVLADMVWHSVFPQREIGVEHDVIAEEIVMYSENPGEHISDLLSQALWAPHPLGRPIAGSLDSIARISRGDLTTFTQRHHTRRDVVIAIAGPFEAAEILRLFEPLLPASSDPPPSAEYVPGALPRSPLIEERDTRQVQLALGFAAFGYRDSRRRALRLLSAILGEGSSSRLFRKLREERGLCYHVSSEVTLLADAGALEIHAGLDPAGRDEACDCVRGELEDLALHGPREAELTRAQRLIASELRAEMESTSAHSEWIGGALLRYDHIPTVQDALAAYRAETGEHIAHIARELTQPGHEALAEIRPVEEDS